MRQWVQEKKKNLIEKIKKQVESEYLKNKLSTDAIVVKQEDPVTDKDQDSIQIDTSTTAATII